MEIPDYILRGWLSHFRRIVANGECSPSDHRTRDAFRLAAKDIIRLEKYLNEKQQR